MNDNQAVGWNGKWGVQPLIDNDNVKRLRERAAAMMPSVKEVSKNIGKRDPRHGDWIARFEQWIDGDDDIDLNVLADELIAANVLWGPAVAVFASKLEGELYD